MATTDSDSCGARAPPLRLRLATSALDRSARDAPGIIGIACALPHHRSLARYDVMLPTVERRVDRIRGRFSWFPHRGAPLREAAAVGSLRCTVVCCIVRILCACMHAVAYRSSPPLRVCWLFGVDREECGGFVPRRCGRPPHCLRQPATGDNQWWHSSIAEAAPPGTRLAHDKERRHHRLSWHAQPTVRHADTDGDTYAKAPSTHTEIRLYQQHIIVYCI
jgi:hypothetical protein